MPTNIYLACFINCNCYYIWHKYLLLGSKRMMANTKKSRWYIYSLFTLNWINWCRKCKVTQEDKSMKRFLLMKYINNRNLRRRCLISLRKKYAYSKCIIWTNSCVLFLVIFCILSLAEIIKWAYPWPSKILPKRFLNTTIYYHNIKEYKSTTYQHYSYSVYRGALLQW